MWGSMYRIHAASIFNWFTISSKATLETTLKSRLPAMAISMFLRAVILLMRQDVQNSRCNLTVPYQNQKSLFVAIKVEGTEGASTCD